MYTLFPIDPHHEELVRQGMDDIVQLLLGADVRALQIVFPGSQPQYASAYSALHVLQFDILPWFFYSWGRHSLLLILALNAAMVILVDHVRIYREDCVSKPGDTMKYIRQDIRQDMVF